MLVWQLLGFGLVALIVAWVLPALWRLPDPRFFRPLIGLMVTVLLWAGGEVVTAFSSDLFWEQIGIAVLYSGAIFIAPIWWTITNSWAAEQSVTVPFAGRGWVRWPFVWAGAMWLVMLSNPWHGLFLTPVIGERNLYHPLWWAMAIPSYMLAASAFGVAIHVLFATRAQTVRRQAVLMACAGIVMLLSNWLYVLHTVPSINATLVALAVSGAVIMAGLYREGLFGLLPVALPVIASRDPDGLVLFRSGGRVAWANGRAHELFAPVALAPNLRLPEAFEGLMFEPDLSSPNEIEAGLEEVWWQRLLAPTGRLVRFGEDGERWLRLRAQAIRGSSGQLIALCLRVRDVTEEERVEAELRQARRLESVAGLARGVAHDFRNLMAITSGNAELLAAELSEHPNLLMRTDRILEAARRAGELANQLQLYSGGGEAFRTPVDLSEIVRETVQLGAGLDELGTRLDLELSSEPLWIEADATQLRQTVANLCANAREALPEEGGSIRVRTGRGWVEPHRIEGLVIGRDQATAEYAWVRVSDTGSGITSEARERIFEPFFSTRGKRRGIGLSIVLGIARAHDALVEVTTQPGRGSDFTLYLPVERVRS